MRKNRGAVAKLRPGAARCRPRTRISDRSLAERDVIFIPKANERSRTRIRPPLSGPPFPSTAAGFGGRQPDETRFFRAFPPPSNHHTNLFATSSSVCLTCLRFFRKIFINMYKHDGRPGKTKTSFSFLSVIIQFGTFSSTRQHGGRGRFVADDVIVADEPMSVWRSRRWPRALATLVPSGCAGFFSFENGVTVVGASGQRKNGAKTVAVFQKKRRRMEGGGWGSLAAVPADRLCSTAFCFVCSEATWLFTEFPAPIRGRRFGPMPLGGLVRRIVIISNSFDLIRSSDHVSTVSPSATSIVSALSLSGYLP